MIKTTSKYFKFQEVEPRTTPAVNATGSTLLKSIQTVAKSQRYSKNMAKVAVPTNGGVFNIVKSFRWTKSSLNSVTVNNTPTITLREMEVINPAFFNNIALFIDQLVNREKTGLLNIGDRLFSGEGQNAVQQGMSDLRDANAPSAWANLLSLNLSQLGGDLGHHLFSSAVAGANALSNDFESLRQYVLGSDPISGPAYLRQYERIYGIHYTGFKYKIPYLEDSYKEISNSWGSENTGGMVMKGVNAMTGLTNLLSPSVGVDFAKTFDYPQSGPSYNINFYLDNTVYDGKEMALDNLTFIYLLLYQNLPNRINRTAITPPVIYQAFLPGVFSYRWSYLSKINVNFCGVRRPFHANIGGEQTEAIIPEGYEVQLTLTSLTPETKNLFFDSLNNAVNATEEFREPTAEEMSKVQGQLNGSYKQSPLEKHQQTPGISQGPTE